MEGLELKQEVLYIVDYALKQLEDNSGDNTFGVPNGKIWNYNEVRKYLNRNLVLDVYTFCEEDSYFKVGDKVKIIPDNGYRDEIQRLMGSHVTIREVTEEGYLIKETEGMDWDDHWGLNEFENRVF